MENCVKNINYLMQKNLSSESARQRIKRMKLEMKNQLGNITVPAEKVNTTGKVIYGLMRVLTEIDGGD